MKYCISKKIEGQKIITIIFDKLVWEERDGEWMNEWTNEEWWISVEWRMEYNIAIWILNPFIVGERITK